MRAECEQFVGRKCDICNGEADIPFIETNKYRKSWGLPELLPHELPKVESPFKARPVRSSFIPIEEVFVSSLTCAHRGEIIGEIPCGCGSPPKLYQCSIYEKCTLIRDGGNRRKAIEAAKVAICIECPSRTLPGQTTPIGPPPPRKRRPTNKPRRSPFYYKRTLGSPEFVTLARFATDAKALVSVLPANTSKIIGVARSGLTAANLVAMFMHRPVEVMRQSKGDVIEGGNGWRLTGNTSSDGAVVVIDDTVMTGNSFMDVIPRIRKVYPNAISAAIYCNPNANVKPDLWVRELPWPHLLEWNLFNSILSPSMAVDFDGILCHDCPPGHDDDGWRYERFLQGVKPLYYMRRTTIPMIVTARLEKYRPQTMDWLARHGMSVQELIMWPGSDYRERSTEKVAQFKATHYSRFLTHKYRIQPTLFVESDANQAQRIAQISGGLVVCPAAGRVFP
jgi:orotate phosphoribosyltransferase